MRNLIPLFLVLILAGCTGNSSKVSEDERERSVDWQSDLSFSVTVRDAASGIKRQVIVPGSFLCSGSLDVFVDQLFDLAFSGDATVLLPTVLGEPDWADPTSPEALVELLGKFDTTHTADLETGELVEITIDNSYSSSSASGLGIFSSMVATANGVEFSPYMIMLGEQVFDPTSGNYRGMKPRFYIQLGDDPAGKPQQNFYFRSDSLGQFYLDHMGSFYEDGSQQYLHSNLFQGSLPDSTPVKFSQHWEFDSRVPALQLTTEVMQMQAQ